MKKTDSGRNPEEILSCLLQFVSENKRRRFEEVIRQRTRHITVVLEDIFQPHNASAVLRTCEVFGIQDIHVIETRNRYEVNPDVALGSSKWLTLIRYGNRENNTEECLRTLKSRGYSIIAASPHEQGHTPEDLPLAGRVALLFGTELEGLSETALKMADGFVRIPMYGFTESLNISVSAALLIRTLTERLRHSGIPWQLRDEEMTEIRLGWARQAVRKSSLIEKAFRGESTPDRDGK